LRDIVVTEYGIADLRSKTDREVVTALIGVMDARFQDGLVASAQRAGKLPRNFRVADTARQNTPEQLAHRFAPWRRQGLFAELPFGSEFTAEEVKLARALRALAAASAHWPGRLRLARRVLTSMPDAARFQTLLERMELSRPRGLSERLQRRLLLAALRDADTEPP
jgi:hypothetical protein